MRLKYTLEKNRKANELVLKEYVQVADGQFSLLNRSIYNRKTLSTAVSKGKRTLISALRSETFYPPIAHMDKIADEVIRFLNSRAAQAVEIVLDDLDLIDKNRKRKKAPAPAAVEEIYDKEAYDVDADFDARSDDTCTLRFDEDATGDPEEIFPFDEVA